MSNNIETIDGIKGEWRTVTKASEVTVGQRVRYTVHGCKIGYSSCKTHYAHRFYDKNTLSWEDENIQAFFPLAVKPKRKIQDEEDNCTKKKCRFFDKSMSQNCARAINSTNDIPYASICKDRTAKRKVAKVTISQKYASSLIQICGLINGVKFYNHYSSRKSALRGARRFCKAISYECEIIK